MNYFKRIRSGPWPKASMGSRGMTGLRPKPTVGVKGMKSSKGCIKKSFAAVCYNKNKRR